MLTFRDTNIDSLTFYAKKLQNSNDVCYQYKGVRALNYIPYSEENYPLSEKRTLSLIKNINNSLKETPNRQCLLYLKINCYNRLFWIKKNQENYTEAYQYLISMNEVIDRIDSPIKKHQYSVSNKLNKAQIKRVLNMDREAINILLDVVFKAKKVNDTAFISENLKLINSHLYNSLGKSYLILASKTDNTQLLDSANIYFDKSYEVTKTFNPIHKSSKLFYYYRKTEVLIAQKKFKEAIKLINEYKNINNGLNYKHREFFQKAICFHNLNKADSAIYHANKLLNDKKDKCSRSNLITLYDILSKQYLNLNKQDSAYKYSSKTLEEFQIARNNKEETYQLLYKNDLKNAQELNNSLIEKSKKENSSYMLFIAIPAISIIAIIAFFYRKEKKRNKKLYKKIITVTEEPETTKKEYNIDEKLEKEILNKLYKIKENHEYLQPDFSINKIANELNTNSTYISFVFNSKKEESFKQYYTKLKIEYIIDKLKTDKTYRMYSIQTLAEEVGYSNASAFSRAFKKHTGVTPSIFLKTLDD
ncbi:helix-turn-helix domain-containing protein [Tenacibaculum holothuriorum]|uniref:helix-turn-helix domain-containing protein n=1 Tax=Tenacibaculum holothuriorum TaxID=1635173 RepID=UPI001302D3E9|nr:helix-turn-helix domain-containing protein [Tenacibaculum holothuriorum]